MGMTSPTPSKEKTAVLSRKRVLVSSIPSFDWDRNIPNSPYQKREVLLIEQYNLSQSMTLQLNDFFREDINDTNEDESIRYESCS
jgi:hypothetical protein